MLNDVKKQLWKELFPNEPMIEPHDGAVEEYAGCLAKHLPEDFNTPCPIFETCENKDREFWKCFHLKGGGCYEYYAEILTGREE